MTLELTTVPYAEATMRIRRPAAEVFEAFVDPAITSQFWFTKGSGRLELGGDVTWEWEMYGVSTSVRALVVDPGQRLVIEWDGYSGRTTVEWTFTAHDDGSTHVVVRESGWTGSGDELVGYVRESTQGFTWTLAGLKAWLEHGLRMGFVADVNPDAHVAGWRAR